MRKSQQTNSGGVRAWRSGKSDKRLQWGSRKASTGNARHKKADQQKEPASSLEKQEAGEESPAPKFDILDSPPQKLRSGKSFCRALISRCPPVKSHNACLLMMSGVHDSGWDNIAF